MTPAVKAAQRAGIPFTLHTYAHDPANTHFGEEAAQALGLSPDQVFKTLIADLGGELVVAVIPVACQLNLKALAKALGAKRALMAEVARAERSSGYVAGGISPLGQRKALRTCIDRRAFDLERIHVSAGRRGLEIELAASDLQRLTRAITAPIGEP
ncbi:Cys-tRNA(Pro) deacylase [Aestuariirhabdus litorea]|uniref:Cys-tRNA(Pro)/Cys-tRNA(Cys) deacylase n=1 Tax=Aestuariirhabdus litorea TaxID=2528527 RepID=A0A3P3VNE3_9GAMM|nr:Cys-tRNA(Pro) deacylase [Aestuariirhabdus litorea]RRJ83438.1 Cys-tRNA(Pro) deacylase [Aestuariirhabdus litorea]RWW93600.1 Cys-tRNA(Pro) deacylase [Endozoicomonadaceae bacterium GTF-13]